MSNYALERDESGRQYYRFLFAGREIKLIDHPGAILSVQDLASSNYETPLPILLMASIARLDGSFVDVGANIGIYSVLATKTKPDVCAYAFEPLLAARAVLEENLRINGTLSQVEISDCALSDNEGVADLHLPDAGHGLLETSASLERSFKSVAARVQVSVKTLDSLKLPIAPAVIKADIEGHEAAFLRGAVQTLCEYRPFVYAEMLSGASKSFFRLSQMMMDLNYISFRMRPDAVIYTKIIFADKGWNYAFIPGERIDVFRDCCRAHDIEMLQSY